MNNSIISFHLRKLCRLESIRNAEKYFFYSSAQNVRFRFLFTYFSLTRLSVPVVPYVFPMETISSIIKGCELQHTVNELKKM